MSATTVKSSDEENTNNVDIFGRKVSTYVNLIGKLEFFFGANFLLLKANQLHFVHFPIFPHSRGFP